MYVFKLNYLTEFIIQKMRQNNSILLFMFTIFSITLVNAELMFTPHSGKFVLSFDYAPKQGYVFSTSSFNVLWNEFIIFSYLPTDYNIHTFFLNVEAQKGNNTLCFAGTGITGPNDRVGATITNIKLSRDTICGHEDAIVNGDFKLGHNIGTGVQLVPSILGWKGNPDMEIGHGPYYNSRWPSGTYVTQLDTLQNTVITQVIKLDVYHRIVGQ